MIVLCAFPRIINLFWYSTPPQVAIGVNAEGLVIITRRDSAVVVEYAYQGGKEMTCFTPCLLLLLMPLSLSASLLLRLYLSLSCTYTHTLSFFPLPPRLPLPSPPSLPPLSSSLCISKDIESWHGTTESFQITLAGEGRSSSRSAKFRTPKGKDISSFIKEYVAQMMRHMQVI